MFENGDQQQIHQQQGDHIVTAERLLCCLKLVAGAGQANADGVRNDPVVTQLLHHVPYLGHAAFQWHRAGRNDIQRHRAAAINPADHTGIYGFLKVSERG